jgi:hypothetical protein
MGRHSAADEAAARDDADVHAAAGAAGGAAVAVDTRPRGRHSAPDAVPDSVPDGPDPTPSVPTTLLVDVEAPAAPGPPARVRGTRADLGLLRAHPAVRAQCAAAIVVPFVLYGVFLAVTGSDHAIRWLPVPILLAGVLFGLMLDLAHRRYDRPAAPVDQPVKTVGPAQPGAPIEPAGSIEPAESVEPVDLTKSAAPKG